MEVPDWLPSLSPTEVLFWSGAGISADPPTRGPLGNTLGSRALENYFEPGTGQELRELYSKLELPNARVRPRLETILDALMEVYGVTGLADVLSDLVNPLPNRNHWFFAQHLARGGRHVTANFDRCIEVEAELIEKFQGVSPTHIHGSLGKAADLASLGARMHTIQNGIPSTVQRLLDRDLEDPRVKAVIFVGYSGSDFFDVTPFLQSRSHLFRERFVVWHEHMAGSRIISLPAADDHRYVQLARASGAQTFRIQGQTRDLLAIMADAWELPTRTEVDLPMTSWAPALTPHYPQRRLATVGLLARMGVRRRVIELASDIGLPQSDALLDRLADALSMGCGPVPRCSVALDRSVFGERYAHSCSAVRASGVRPLGSRRADSSRATPLASQVGLRRAGRAG